MRSAPSHRSPTPALILLVDDNQDGVVARRSVLEELGYKVTSACCGRDALQAVEKQNFDLIITDYKMAPINGLEFIGTLRKQGFRKPIILLSGFAESLGFHRESSGADAVIQKSANEIAQLVRCTKRLLTAPKKPSASRSSDKKEHRNAAS